MLVRVADVVLARKRCLPEKFEHAKMDKNILSEPTGSFRKNGKSKMVFMGTKFHEKLIFSAFFSLELATNLRS